MGMQNKLLQIQKEKHMNIFGLQIKAFKFQEDSHNIKTPDVYSTELLENSLVPILIEDQERLDLETYHRIS